MYSTKLLNKNMVSGNAYITVGDPYKHPDPNPFRQGKKGEKLNPFRTKVSKSVENAIMIIFNIMPLVRLSLKTLKTVTSPN
jgi:hypothetical protein